MNKEYNYSAKVKADRQDTHYVIAHTDEKGVTRTVHIPVKDVIGVSEAITRSFHLLDEIPY